jgi:hypothetical protein
MRNLENDENMKVERGEEAALPLPPLPNLS